MTKFRFYLYPSLITACIILLVYIIKSIYPFGDNTVMWADMHQINTPLTYYFYDIFKGNGSIFYNFKSSLGMNFYGVFFFFLASPFNFILLLFPREDIYLAMSLLLLLKMMIISFTAFIFFNKYFKTSLFYKVLFSILYAFSGYVLLLHTNIMWLDNVILFPILLITLKNLYDKEKLTGYIIVLALNIIFCFYISYMVIFFILFSSIPYLFYYVKKEERGRKVLLLGIGTITALAISSFVIIPTYLQISNSSRLNFSLIETLTTREYFFLDKISFFFMGTIVYALICLTFRRIKHDKNIYFIAWLLILTMIQVVFDSVNKLWHTGSYEFFPLRYGFIPNFILLILGMYIIDHYEIKFSKIKNYWPIYLGVIFTSIITIVIIFYDEITSSLVQFKFNRYGFETGAAFIYLLLIVLFFVLGYIYIIKFVKTKKHQKILIASFIIIELFINSLFYIGIGLKAVNREYENISKVKDVLKNLDDGYRVKDLVFNNNASLIYDINGIGHFTSLSNQDTLNMLKKLGYTSYWVRSFDIGGTIFTDSLLSQKYIITNYELDESLYTINQQLADDLYIYEANYTLPQGILINNELTRQIDYSLPLFEIQNQIYQVLMNDERLFNIYDNFTYHNVIKTTKDNGLVYLDKVDSKKEGYLELKINPNDEILYLNLFRDLDYEISKKTQFSFKVYVNNEPVDFNVAIDKYYLLHKPVQPEINIYPHRFDNGIINLGKYNEEVTIKLELVKPVEFKELTIGALKIDKFKNFINTYQDNEITITMSKNKIRASVNSDDDDYLFLNIPYDSAWKVIVNGKELRLEKVLGNLSGIKLEAGENQIEMTYIPKGYKLSLIISALILVIFISSAIIFRKFKLKNYPIFKYLYYGYISLYTLAVIFVYLFPIILEIFSFLIV